MSDAPAPETNTCVKVFDFVTKFMRPLNFAFGGLTIACGVYDFILSLNSDPSYFGIILRCALSCIFTVILGLLLLVGEIPRLAMVKNNCKFLILFLGRGLFNVFVGGWVYGLAFLSNTDSFPKVLYYINWIGLFVLGGIFIVMHFCGKSKFIHSEPEAEPAPKV